MSTRLINILAIVLSAIVLTMLIIDINTQYKKKEQTDHSLHEDAILVAKVINSECKDCSDVDKLMIGSSILNRADNVNFPSSIANVIRQPNQYVSSKDYTVHDKQLAVCLLEGYFRDCEVIYFYNPETATNRKFVKMMKKYPLVLKTKHHEYYGI